MNTAGHALLITIFGESHGVSVGCALEGLPAGMKLDVDTLKREIDMRRPAPLIGTARHEADVPEIVSGVLDGRLTGTPVVIIFRNTDVNSASYSENAYIPRPGHADYTALIRYGGNSDIRGGGQFSGRMTAPLVAAGACARQFLFTHGIRVAARVRSIHTVSDEKQYPFEEIEERRFSNEIRCIDPEAAKQMRQAILAARKQGDSVGGVVECRAAGVPAGIGDPFFDTVEGQISKLAFSVPAVKGIEFGSGFSSTRMKGSENNDPFAFSPEGRVITLTNNAGGINGGITNGMEIVFRVAFKPTSSISLKQKSIDLRSRQNTELVVRGRHDPCIVPRAVIVVEAVCCLAIADLLLRSDIHG